VQGLHDSSHFATHVVIIIVFRQFLLLLLLLKVPRHHGLALVLADGWLAHGGTSSRRLQAGHHFRFFVFTNAVSDDAVPKKFLASPPERRRRGVEVIAACYLREVTGGI